MEGDAAVVDIIQVADATPQTDACGLSVLLSLWLPPGIPHRLCGGGHGILGERRRPALLRRAEPVAGPPLPLARAFGYEAGDGAGKTLPLPLRPQICDADDPRTTGQKARPGTPNAHAQWRDSAQTCHHHAAHHGSIAWGLARNDYSGEDSICASGETGARQPSQVAAMPISAFHPQHVPQETTEALDSN